jgi:hypothetical protein
MLCEFEPVHCHVALATDASKEEWVVMTCPKSERVDLRFWLSEICQVPNRLLNFGAMLCDKCVLNDRNK